MQDLLARPTAHEDGVLRRLHFFEQLGWSLSLPLQHLKAEIRFRDRRLEVRSPAHTVLVEPLAAR